MSVSVYSSDSVVAPFDLSCAFHRSQYAVSAHFSIKNSHSTVQSALWLQCTQLFCEILIIVTFSLITTAHAFLSNNLLCHKGSTLQYSALVQGTSDAATLWEGNRVVELEMRGPVLVACHRLSYCSNKYYRNCEKSVPKSYFALLGLWHGVQWERREQPYVS